MSQKDIDPSVGSAVAAALVQLSCQNWQLLSAKRLSGGAINQNFLIELQDEQAQTIRWVMRRGQSAGIPGTHGRADEYALFEFAHALGLTVPKPIALVQTDDGLVSFFEFRSGQADGRKLVQWLGGESEASTRTAPAITRQLGVELGRLHGTKASEMGAQTLAKTLGPRPAHSIEAAMVLVEKSFACVRQPTSYLTYATEQVLQEGRQLASQLTGSAASVCHNDFRLGNLMMDPESGRLTAVLDWEFASWGDVMADIGWLTAPCWRFGGAKPVAGFGELADLVSGLSSTMDVTEAQRLQTRLQNELAFWQRYAHLRWAIIAAQQGERAVPGDVEALELVITGCMSASLAEPVVSFYKGQDVVGMAKATTITTNTATNTTTDADGSAGISSDPSTADRLLAEAAAHLKLHLVPQLSGAQKYSALMAANAIRLARGALACASDDRSAATDPVIEDLVFDLRIWSFKG